MFTNGLEPKRPLVDELERNGHFKVRCHHRRCPLSGHHLPQLFELFLETERWRFFTTGVTWPLYPVQYHEHHISNQLKYLDSFKVSWMQRPLKYPGRRTCSPVAINSCWPPLTHEIFQARHKQRWFAIVFLCIVTSIFSGLQCSNCLSLHSNLRLQWLQCSNSVTV